MSTFPVSISTDGGTYTMGSGETLSTITINPFALELPSFGATVTINPVGTFTLAPSPIDQDPVKLGQLSFVINGDGPHAWDFYAGARFQPGNFWRFGPQTDGGFSFLDENGIIELQFIPAEGQPGAVGVLSLQIISSGVQPGGWISSEVHPGGWLS